VTTVVMFVADTFSASSRLRALAFVDMLRRDGVNVRVCRTVPSKYLPYPASWPRIGVLRGTYRLLGLPLVVAERLAQILRHVAAADVVLLQKDLLFRTRVDTLERLLLSRARAGATRVVLDIDDAIYLGTSAAPRASARAKVTLLAQRADLVLAGSEPIADWMRAAGGRTRLLPTVVASGPEPNRSYARRTAAVRIAWVGTASSSRQLAECQDALIRLAAATPVVLDVVSRTADLPADLLAALPGVRIHEWSEAAEQRALADCDVALAPLGDEPYAQARCGGKVLSYFRAGIPVVASPIGAQAQLVRHEVTGLVARTTEEWYAHLRRLSSDEELRARLGAAGRRHMTTHRDLETCYPRWRAEVLGDHGR
jgi:hypothetical protein